MLTLDEVIKLRNDFENGNISYEHAKEIYFDNYKEEKRSWHTEDWKKRRNETLKDECEICNGKETLTIQHLSHPKKLHKYKNEVTTEYSWVFKEHNPSIEKTELIEHINTNYDYTPLPLCPKCQSRHPSLRTRKKPQYLCKDCHHEFDEPIYQTLEKAIELYYKGEDPPELRGNRFKSKNKYKDEKTLNKVIYLLQREMAELKYNDDIAKESFLRYLNDNIKYLSFEDTITACKKCAFNYDINKMELCPKCNRYYKGISYPTCINCLPDEKRNAALKTKEFRKEFEKAFRSMHKDLEID